LRFVLDIAPEIIMLLECSRTLAQAKGFRCRGKEINRIEAFSDTVFGFALTRQATATAPAT
jgi:hypothetical protein